MENTSNALLIAASVLIVIILIAFGMKIFNSADDTSKDSSAIGNDITKQSNGALADLKQTFNKINGQNSQSTNGKISPQNFNNLISFNVEGHTHSIEYCQNNCGKLWAIDLDGLRKRIEELNQKYGNEHYITSDIPSSYYSSSNYPIISIEKDSNGYITEVKITIMDIGPVP